MLSLLAPLILPLANKVIDSLGGMAKNLVGNVVDNAVSHTKNITSHPTHTPGGREN